MLLSTSQEQPPTGSLSAAQPAVQPDALLQQEQPPTGSLSAVQPDAIPQQEQEDQIDIHFVPGVAPGTGLVPQPGLSDYSKQRQDIGGGPIQCTEQEKRRRNNKMPGVLSSVLIPYHAWLLRSCERYDEAELECVTSLSNEQKRHLYHLEQSIIDTISSKLCSSAVYNVTFQIGDNRHYTRWMEWGLYKGASKHFQEKLPHSRIDPVSWQVMTTNDLGKQIERQVGSGRRWSKIIFTNKFSVDNSVKQLLACNVPAASILGIVVHIDKAIDPGKLDRSSDFHVDQGVYSDSSDVMSNYRLHGTESAPAERFDDFVGKITAWDCISFQQQARIINSIDNDTGPNGRQGVLVCQHYSSGTGEFRGEDKHPTSNYIPTSKRNRILYFQRFGRHNKDIIKILQADSDEPATVPQVKRNLPQNSTRVKVVRSCSPTEHVQGNSNKTDTNTTPAVTCRVQGAKLANKGVQASKSRQTHKIKGTKSEGPAKSRSPGSQDPLKRSTCTPPHDQHYDDFCTFKQTLFIKFVHHLLSEGCLQWRIHSEDIDVIAMNDVNLDSASFKKNQFVHVYRSKCSQQNQVSYFCNCQMQSLVTAINQDNTCFHIRFLNKYVDPLYDMLFDSPSRIHQTHLNVKIQGSLQSLNIPVFRLDRDSAFHKFSVLSHDLKSCSVVNFNRNIFSCLSGKCKTSPSGHSRKIKDIDSDAVCEHLKNIHQNREQWQCLCHATDDDDDSGELDGIPQDVVHLICDNLDPGTDLNKENFDPSTGLWVFPSISKHVPRNRHDPVFLRSKLSRLRASLSDNKCMEVSPNLDKAMVCKCGKLYYDDTYPSGKVVKRFTNPTQLYTDNGIVSLVICDRQCLNEEAECVLEYSGRQDGLHILSIYTACGDEIGWDYVSHVMNSTITFSGYCSIVNERYPPGESFMSRQTFIDFIFSWMANFRQAFQVRGTNPKVLACDGTKLGIFSKNSFVSPI
ncbi:uncharacterized protein [Amphiura filiformis]|uniref:uncharacterized protein n=1 Tax=Amphiura filiformis TaxID=82378 RepID=UPI003B20D195